MESVRKEPLRTANPSFNMCSQARDSTSLPLTGMQYGFRHGIFFMLSGFFFFFPREQ